MGEMTGGIGFPLAIYLEHDGITLANQHERFAS